MSGFLAEIRLSIYLKIPGNFIRLILSDRFWFVHIIISYLKPNNFLKYLKSYSSKKIIRIR